MLMPAEAASHECQATAIFITTCLVSIGAGVTWSTMNKLVATLGGTYIVVGFERERTGRLTAPIAPPGTSPYTNVGPEVGGAGNVAAGGGVPRFGPVVAAFARDEAGRLSVAEGRANLL